MDANVTRHLQAELAADDWDILILHYLGVDHIGHLEGPNSLRMPAKLAEMDAVLERLWSAMADPSTRLGRRRPLLLLLSDHGMTAVWRGQHMRKQARHYVVGLIGWTYSPACAPP